MPFCDRSSSDDGYGVFDSTLVLHLLFDVVLMSCEVLNRLRSNYSLKEFLLICFFIVESL